jgi:hypothetical protein
MIANLCLLILSLFPTWQARQPFAERQFDEVVAILEKVKPHKYELNDYYFMMAASHYALNHKKQAASHLQKLFDSFGPLARRHEAIGGIIEEELTRWKENDLGDIRRDMRVSGDRLAGAKVGKITQTKQKEIVDKLDKLIKEKEDLASGAGKPKDQNGQPKIGNADGRGSPAQDSTIIGGTGNGTVDDKKLATIAKAWGTMPEKDRARAIMEITKDLPARYRVIIEDYFKALSSNTKP